jgi:hypothetical protein
MRRFALPDKDLILFKRPLLQADQAAKFFVFKGREDLCASQLREESIAHRLSGCILDGLGKWAHW